MPTYSYIYELKDRFSGPIKKIGGGIASANANLQHWGRSVEDNTSKLKRMGDGVLSLRNLLVGSFAVQGIRDVGTEMVSVLSDLTETQTVLRNTLGSDSAAQQVLGDISNFADDTGQNVEGLTNSWIGLANRGFKPTMGEMMKLSDLARSQKKDFNQLTEAMLDAETGEFERLKEFGVKARTEGDKVTFTFKGQQTAVENNSTAIRDYILGLGDLNGVQGLTSQLADETGGKVARMSNAWLALKQQFASQLEPQINALIDTGTNWLKQLQGFVPWVKTNADVIGRWAKLIGYTTGSFIGLWAAAQTVLGVQSMVKTIKTALEGWTIATKLQTAAQWLLNAATSANPLGAVVVVIGAATAGLTYLWNRFEGFRNFFIDLGKWMWNNHPFKWMIDLTERIFPGFKGSLNGLLGGIVGTFKRVFNWLSENVFGPIKDFFGSFFDFKTPASSVNDTNVEFYNPDLGPEGNPYGSVTASTAGAPGGRTSRRASVGIDRAAGAAVSGGGNVKHVTINVEALIKGGVTFANTTYDMSRKKLKTELELLLLDVVNDVNYG